MAKPASKTEFQFVNSTITTPNVQQDLAIRALIRKQAMKEASAARRRHGNYGKHNLRQYPIFDQGNFEVCSVEVDPIRRVSETEAKYVHTRQPSLSSTESEDSDSAYKDKVLRYKRETTGGEWLPSQVQLASTRSIPGSMSRKDYELMSMNCGFDILDLSTLTTYHVGRAARNVLSAEPSQLILQFREKHWTYLSYIPSRYGHITCLNDAVACVLARVRQIISPPSASWEATVISLYVKALGSLQKALDSPYQRFKPEVLCATEILALYELLDHSGETAWIRHAAGAARLIQLRGPKSFNTEFEKALFMAHTGPITTEALINNERCFLEQEAWESVFRSIVVDNNSVISERSEIVISLLILKSRIPGMAKDVTEVVCNQWDENTPDINALVSKAQKLRADLLNWQRDYEDYLSLLPEPKPGSVEHDERCKVIAIYFSCIMIISRLLGAIVPSRRVELEKHTQSYAQQTLDLEREVKAIGSQASFFMAQTAGIARATKATTQDWLETSKVEVEMEEHRGSRGAIIEARKFERWNKLMGRRIT